MFKFIIVCSVLSVLVNVCTNQITGTITCLMNIMTRKKIQPFLTKLSYANFIELTNFETVNYFH